MKKHQIQSSKFKVQGSRFGVPIHHPRSSILSAAVLAILALAAIGCQSLTYTGPNGEQFTRRSLGTQTAISELTVETTTNGLRRVELRGYTNDSTTAIGTVTEAAVRAALQGAK